MTTVVISLTGDADAIAGAGSATFTAQQNDVGWFLGATGGGATAPAVMHVGERKKDVSLEVPDSLELYVVGSEGDEIAVTRDTAPA